MPWNRLLLDPQHGPELPPELLARLVADHQAEIDREQDRITDVVRVRLTRATKPATFGTDPL